MGLLCGLQAPHRGVLAEGSRIIRRSDISGVSAAIGAEG